MNQSEVEAFVESLDNVQREDNFGYVFYFVGDDHRLSFVTIASADHAYDHVSNLNREGVFRVNIGVSRERFTALFDDARPENIDYTVLNTFLPHPDYAKQHFICILNPVEEKAALMKQFIVEAHGIAAVRLAKQA